MTMWCFAVTVTLIVNVMANQCPAGRTENAYAKLVFDDTDPNSSWFYLHEVEFDSATSEYFYFGHAYHGPNNYSHSISRTNFRGDIVWSKAYSNQSFVNTLQYSPTYQSLYYMIKTDSPVLMKVNSSDGNILNSLQLFSSNSSWYDCKCSLSKDELALFCDCYNNLRNIIRFDTNSLRMDIAVFNAYDSRYNRIICISNYEVLYSHKSSVSYFVKARYIQLNESHSSFNEEYHQTYSAYTFDLIFKLDDNEETIWFAFCTEDGINYFQYNATSFSLLGSKYSLSFDTTNSTMQMDVAGEIICIYTTYNIVLINATTKYVIKMYDHNTNSYSSTLSLNNGYISLINRYTRTHYLVPTNYDLDNFNLFGEGSSYSMIVNAFDLSNEAITNHSMSTQTISSVTVSNYEYSIVRNDDQSFILSLPEKLDYSFTVSPGQEFIFNSTCRLDNFSAEPCEVTSYDTLTSLITVNCDNMQIQIKNLTESANVSDSFYIYFSSSIREYSSHFNITYVPCDYSNCESCSNGICDNCSADYQWNYFTSTCESTNFRCPVGYQWNNNTMSCQLVTPQCPTGYQWNNSTLSCESTLEVNSTDDVQVSSTIEGPKCSTYGPTYDTTVSTIIVQVFAGVGICVGITITFLTGASAQSVWTLIHYLQLILILPLVAISMSEKVRGFIVANAFAALSLYPLSLCGAKSMPLFKHLSFDQPDEYLRVLGWSSGSTLVNNIVLLMILFVLTITHFLFCLLHRSAKNKDGRCSLLVMKVRKMFTFNVYIRTFIVIYLFTAVMIVSEIKYYIKNGGDDKFGHNEQGEDNEAKGNYVSIVFSCITLILLLVFLFLTFISWARNKDSREIDESCKTRELYYGIRQASSQFLHQTQDNEDKANDQSNGRIEAYKQQNESNEDDKDEDDKDDDAQDSGQAPDVSLKIKLARLYYAIFLAKRLVLTFLVVLIPDSLFALKVAFVLPLQIAYLAYSIFVRSFTEIKDRVVEVCNEIVMLVLIAFLIKYHSKSEWTSTAESEFIGIALSQTCILSIVSIVSCIIELIKFVKSRRKSDSENYESNEVCKEACQNVEISNSMDDQPSRNLPAIPRGSNMFVVRARTNQDMFEEDKKEGNQSLNNYMM